MADAAQLSLNAFKDEIDDQLTCSVCLDQYTNPKTLPCLHSFCLECIVPLPVKIKENKCYISCPSCRVYHLLPEGGAIKLPNDFKINSLLDLKEKLKTTSEQAVSATCPIHDDPLKVYCETCREVICRDCTISKEHNTHDYHLISECYPKHRQQLQNSLALVKQKLANFDTAVTCLADREKEVQQQGEQLKEELDRHSKLLIARIQRSHTRLSHRLDHMIKQKSQVLAAQNQQAKKVQNQLKACQEKIEQKIKELNEHQLLIEKQSLIKEMSTIMQHTVDPVVFGPLELANITLEKLESNAVGLVSSTSSYEKASLQLGHCILLQPSNASLTLQSQDGKPFPLSPSLISSMLSSPGVDKPPVKCDITQTHPGEYSITFTPSTRHDQLVVQVGGVDIPDSPFTIHAKPLPKMRSEPVKGITGLNAPRGIAVFDYGDIVVAELGANCVTVFNKKGQKMKSFGTRGTMEGQFTNPHGVAISIDGHILVTDEHRLQKLTTDGVCVKSVGDGFSGSGQLQFSYPKGISVHPTSGHIFVADAGNNRIQVFNSDLTFSYTIFCGYNFLNFPSDVAFDSHGYLNVVEWSNNCITILTPSGEYIARYGSHGTALGQLSAPSSLAIHNNLVYITENGNSRVSIFDTNTQSFYCFSKKGSLEGDLKKPHGIAMNKEQTTLYVSDTENHRLLFLQK